MTKASKTNSVWCKDGILHFTIAAPVNETEASRLDAVGEDFVNKGEAIYVLIDLQQSTDFSSNARRTWVKFLKNPKIKRTAIFGGNIFVRTLASFVIAASGQSNIKFFVTEEIATKWLRGGDTNLEN